MSRRRPLIGCRWGSLGGGPVRYGGRHYRLVVYPPGTDDRERWLLRTTQWWPGGGVLLAMAAFGILGGPVGLPVAFAVAAALYLGPLLAARHAVRRARRDLSVVHAESLWGPGTAADLALCRQVVSLSSTLTEAERALDRGQLTPVDFQQIWGDVHAEAKRLQGRTVSGRSRRRRMA
jgi:hypothetical protein